MSSVLGGAPANLPILSGAIMGMGLMQLINTFRVLNAAQGKNQPIVKAAFFCIFFGVAYFILSISAMSFGGFDAPWEKAFEAVLYMLAAVLGDFTFLLRAVPCSNYPIVTKAVFVITALTKLSLYWIISLSSLWPNPPLKGSDRTMAVSTGCMTMMVFHALDCIIQVLSNVYLTSVFVSYLINRTTSGTHSNATFETNTQRYKLVYRTAVEFCALGLTIVSIGRIVRASQPTGNVSQICLDISKAVELCNGPFLVSQMRNILQGGEGRGGSSAGNAPSAMITTFGAKKSTDASDILALKTTVAVKRDGKESEYNA